MSGILSLSGDTTVSTTQTPRCAGHMGVGMTGGGMEEFKRQERCIWVQQSKCWRNEFLQHSWAFFPLSQSRGCKLVASRLNLMGRQVLSDLPGTLQNLTSSQHKGLWISHKTLNFGPFLTSRSIIEPKSPQGNTQVASFRGMCSPPAPTLRLVVSCHLSTHL